MELKVNPATAANNPKQSNNGERADVNTFINQSGTVVGCFSPTKANLVNSKLTDAEKMTRISKKSFTAKQFYLCFASPFFDAVILCESLYKLCWFDFAPAAVCASLIVC